MPASYTYLLQSQVGAANGAAPLDGSGVIPVAYIANVPWTAVGSGSSPNGFNLTADGSGSMTWATTDAPAKFVPFLLMGT